MRVYRINANSRVIASQLPLVQSILSRVRLVPRAHVNDEPDDEAEKSGHSNHDYEPGDVLEEVFPLPIEEQLVVVAVKVKPEPPQTHLRCQRHLRRRRSACFRI